VSWKSGRFLLLKRGVRGFPLEAPGIFGKILILNYNGKEGMKQA